MKLQLDFTTVKTMALIIENDTDPNFIDLTTGFRMKIQHKNLRWDDEETSNQSKWIFVPEHTLYAGTPNEQIVPAAHKKMNTTKVGSITEEVRVYYYKNGGIDIEGNPTVGYGNLINSSAINQGRVVSFRITDSVWVNSTTGVIVPFDSIALLDENDVLIENPHVGLIGEFERFIQLKNMVTLDTLLVGAILQSLSNAAFT